MAKTEDRVDWEKAAATGRQPDGGGAGRAPAAPAAVNSPRGETGQAAPESGWLALAALAPAVGLGLVLSLWMYKGPLVTLAGSVTTFVLSLLGCVLGAVVWLVSGSASVFRHFQETLPWGKPGVWRGLAGVVSLSVVAWLMIGNAAYARVRSPRATRRWIRVLLLASAVLFASAAFTLIARELWVE